jgi:hypothetical protein
MGHFAKIVNGRVTQVIVAEPDFFEKFVDTSPGEWIQCSYNTKGGVHAHGGTPLRKNFPGFDFIYDKQRDAFYEEQPYPSWTLNEDSCLWEAPLPMPNDDKMYVWNESTLSWQEIEQ